VSAVVAGAGRRDARGSAVDPSIGETMPATDETVRAWIDRLEIIDVIHRYSNAVTRRAWDEITPLFTPDAIWESPEFGLRFDDPRDFVSSLADAPGTEVLIQTAHGPVVDLDGDRATACTTIVELVRMAAPIGAMPDTAGEPVNLRHHGFYVDDLASVDGAWRFTHRRFRPIYLEAGAVAGTPLPIPAELTR
jgi:hypothetical protein